MSAPIMAEGSSDASHTPPISRRRIRRGVLIFVGLTIASLLAVFLYTSTDETLDALGRLNPGYLAMSLGMWPIIVWAGGWRNHIVVRHLYPKARATVAIRASLANEGLGALTPSQTGGGLAQAYVFTQAGVPLSVAAASTVITFFSTMSVLLLNATFGLFITTELYEHSTLRTVIQLAYSLFALSFATLILALWKFTWVEVSWTKLSHLIERLLPSSHPEMDANQTKTSGSSAENTAKSGVDGPRSEGVKGRMARVEEKVSEALREFRACLGKFFREAPHLMVYNFATTFALYIAKYVLAYFIVLGLGVPASFLEVAAILAILLFVVYFAPTPGGSGLAEVGTAIFMVPVLPGHLLGVFALLFRFFAVYLSAVAGSTLFLRELARSERQAPTGQQR